SKATVRFTGGSPCSWLDGERERRSQHMAVHAALEEEPPPAGRGDEHADSELSGRRGAAGDLRRTEHTRAAGGPGRADVCVEVVQRPGAEEDRVRQRAEAR